AADLVARCTAAEAAIHGKAAAPVPSAGPERGTWAVQLFEARKGARFECARARAAVGTLEAAERSRLEDQLAPKDRPKSDAAPATPNADSDAGK
ncbi:MAG TPA: hypothetical protein VGQ57_05305, partial [Polyangiaceae bacterium]|nr:hypothetical protein [Polyangiaceae bacterium]